METGNKIVNAFRAPAMDDARIMNMDYKHNSSRDDGVFQIIEGLGDLTELVWHPVSCLIEFLSMF